jgi:hypothetical protein
MADNKFSKIWQVIKGEKEAIQQPKTQAFFGRYSLFCIATSI